MAFNPLHQLRKRQKILLAGVTIMTMFIFIAQFGVGGGGDFFALLTAWITGRGEKTTVASLYDQSVSQQDVKLLQQQRRLANDYMYAGLKLVAGRIQAEAVAHWKSSIEKKPEVLGMIQLSENIARMKATQAVQEFDQKMRGSGFGGLSPQQREDYHDRFFASNRTQELKKLRQEFALSQKLDEAKLIEEHLAFEEGLRHLPPITKQILHFRGALDDVKDLLHFKIWLHKADQLGVQLNDTDLATLINREFHNQLFQDEKSAREAFRKLQKDVNASSETIISALRDEFRVRLAKAALGYEEPGEVDLDQTPVTPYEAWQFFQKQRAESTVDVLAIPVRHKGFLAQVGEPKEEELRALYEKHKMREYDPGSDPSGFMQPKRIGVEWVSAPADSPFYRAETDKLIRFSRPAMQIVPSGFDPAAGIASASAVALALPTVYDLPLVAAYESQIYSYPAPTWSNPYISLFHESNWNQPENAALKVAAVVGPSATGGTILSTPLAAYQAVFAAREVKDRGSIGTTLVLAGTTPLPFAAAGMYGFVAPTSEFLPLKTVQSKVEESMRSDLAQKLASDNMRAVREELWGLNGLHPEILRQQLNAKQPEFIASLFSQLAGSVSTAEPGITALISYGSLANLREVKDRSRRNAEWCLMGAVRSPLMSAALVCYQENLPRERSRAYLNDAVKKYGLRRGISDKLRDPYDIAEDKGLKPLMDSFQNMYRYTAQAKDYHKRFFPVSDGESPDAIWPIPYLPQQMPAEEKLWNGSKEPFLFWKTAEQPAYVPAFEQVKEKVKDQWRLEKARDFAKKEAEQVAEKARKSGGDAERILKDGSQHSEKMFQLKQVARLTKPRSMVESEQGGIDYKPYRGHLDLIEHPSDDFLEKLLNLKERGEVVVLHDRPQTNYYVAVLVSRAIPDFQSEYNLYGDKLLSRLMQEKQPQENLSEEILKQLEKEARMKIISDFSLKPKRDDAE